MPIIRAHSRNPRSHMLVLAALIGLVVTLAGCGHKSVEDYLTTGDRAMQNTKLADAETAYQAAAKAAPNDPRPHMALGNLYLFEQKLQAAQLEFLTTLELEPRNPAAHAALGNTYSGTPGQLGLAEEQYRAAVALAPTDTRYRLSLAGTLQKQSKLGEAEAEIRTALGLEPKNARAHLALANLLNLQPNRQSEAEAEYAQVRALEPSLLPAAMTAAPGGAPAASAAPGTAAAPVNVRAINRKFLLTRNSPVYQTPTTGATVVAQVHRGKFVRVTGITGNWFRIQLRNGTVGFIPVATAE